MVGIQKAGGLTAGLFVLVFLAVSAFGCSPGGGKTGDSTEKAVIGAKEGPAIHVAEPTFDFGDVARGEKISHVFKLKNVGNEVLHIDKARGS